MKRALLVTLFCCSSALAETTVRGGPFAGIGLSTGYETAAVATSGQSSKFETNGYLLEAGTAMINSSNFGLVLSAEIGQNNTTNSHQTTSFVEVGSLSYYAAKAGLLFDHIGVGAIYQHDDIKITSISSPGSGQESRYSGWIPGGFVNAAYDVDQRFRAIMEIHYTTGNLTPSDSSLPTATFTDLSFSLRLMILF